MQRITDRASATAYAEGWHRAVCDGDASHAGNARRFAEATAAQDRIARTLEDLGGHATTAAGHREAADELRARATQARAAAVRGTSEREAALAAHLQAEETIQARLRGRNPQP